MSDGSSPLLNEKHETYAVARAKGVSQAAADAAAQRVSSIIVPMRESGSTLQQIAEALNAAGVPTPRGREWKPMSVKNALTRLDAA